MAEVILAAQPALADSDAAPMQAAPWRRRIGDVELLALNERRLLVLALSTTHRHDAAGALSDALDMDAPTIGHSSQGLASRRLLGVQRDQWWLIDGAASTSWPELDGVAWITDQSDGWSTLVVSGPGTLAVLERLVPLDVARFEPGQLARTVIEHVAAIVLRTAAERFELLTPRSSIASFAHALENVATHVAAQRARLPSQRLEY